MSSELKLKTGVGIFFFSVTYKLQKSVKDRMKLIWAKKTKPNRSLPKYEPWNVLKWVPQAKFWTIFCSISAMDLLDVFMRLEVMPNANIPSLKFIFFYLNTRSGHWRMTFETFWQKQDYDGNAEEEWTAQLSAIHGALD